MRDIQNLIDIMKNS